MSPSIRLSGNRYIIPNRCQHLSAVRMKDRLAKRQLTDHDAWVNLVPICTLHDFRLRESRVTLPRSPAG